MERANWQKPGDRVGNHNPPGPQPSCPIRSPEPSLSLHPSRSKASVLPSEVADTWGARQEVGGQGLPCALAGPRLNWGTQQGDHLLAGGPRGPSRAQRKYREGLEPMEGETSMKPGSF